MSTAAVQTQKTAPLAAPASFAVPPPTPDWNALLGQAIVGTPAALYFGGTLYAFTHDTDGKVGICEVGPTGASGTWGSYIGGSLATTTSPSVAASPDGSIGVVARMSNGQIEINYVRPFQKISTGFGPIGGGTPAGTTFVGSPVMVVNSDSRLEVFTLDSTGSMWHCFQQNSSPPILFSNWLLLTGQRANLDVTAVFCVIPLSPTAGHGAMLQAVALGSDHQMYQSTQGAGRVADGWSTFQVIAPTSLPAPNFATGTAAAYCTSTQQPVYAGFDKNAGKLVYCAPGSANTWTEVPGTSDDDSPLPNTVPVIADNLGTPQLTWLATSTQQFLVSQNTAVGANFWSAPQAVGSQNGDLTGNAAVVINSGNVAIFELGFDHNLQFIQFPPS